MVYCKFKIHVLLVWSIFAYEVYCQQNTTSLLCRYCDRAFSLGECQGLVKCDRTHQECYMEEFITDQLTVQYRSGCRSRNQCHGATPLLVGRKRRGDLISCSRCCDKNDDCNALLCGISNATVSTSIPLSANNSLKCKRCENAREPAECSGFVWCDATLESCFMEESVLESSLIVYNGGCKSKDTCGYFWGKRANLVSCSRCCDTNECNQHLCGISEGKVVVQHRKNNTLKCKFCQNAVDQRDCPDYALCDNQTEACYVDEVVTPQLTTIFNAGCRHKQMCPASSTIAGRKRDLVACSRCCDWGDMCNSLICGINGSLVHPSASTLPDSLHLNGPSEEIITVMSGNSLKMICDVSGPAGKTFNWTKENGCNGFYQGANDSTLVKQHTTIGDAGTYVCTVKYKDQNVTKLFHVKITERPGSDICDFDQGSLCSWQQLQDDDFDWTLQSGPTITDDTGPDNDHTKGTGQGKYLYVESSAPRRAGEYARLASHVLPANTTMCFKMWYYMYGDGIGNLFVYLQDSCSLKETEVSYHSANQGQKWIETSVSISEQSVPKDYRIIIKADVGPSFTGDTAIDDLSINNGHCT